MNRWNIHPIPHICLPLTSVSSQNSNASSLVSVFLRIKRRLELQRGILQILRRTTTGTAQWRWSSIGINVLVLREMILKNKNNFEIINLFFHCQVEKFSDHLQVPKATDTFSEYVILTAFPVQQWLHEYDSMSHYMYVANLVSI